MIDGLHCRNAPGVFTGWVAGVHIAIIFRKAATGNIDSNAVSFAEKLTYSLQVNNILIYLPRGYQFGVNKIFDIGPGLSHHTHIESSSIGVNIYDLSRKIGIGPRLRQKV
jgi:hypothetical protein